MESGDLAWTGPVLPGLDSDVSARELPNVRLRQTIESRTLNFPQPEAVLSQPEAVLPHTEAVPPQTDEAIVNALMERVANGSEAAFKELTERIRPRVLAELRKSLKSSDDADDLLQEVFMLV